MPAKSKKQIVKKDPIQIISDDDIQGVSDEEIKPVKPKKTRVKKASGVPVTQVVYQSDDEVLKVKKTKKVVSKPIDIPVVVPKKPVRKLSQYNQYVKMKMMDTDIKLLPSKERFTRIAAAYKYDKEHDKLPKFD
jgi:1-acyl-sn-glycerol-3-phosphate acyltransferase